MKSGTPIGSESQCVTCKFSMLLQGFRESEELTYCDFLSKPILVSFQVRECSRYVHQSRPTWEQMEELALQIRPTPTLKPAGFCIDQDSQSEAAVPETAETRRFFDPGDRLPAS